MPNQSTYDAIIIGGGPAGLTCAIFLGRYRRNVLLIDGGKPRNYAARAVHGFLGMHGIAPHELRARGRGRGVCVPPGGNTTRPRIPGGSRILTARASSTAPTATATKSAANASA